MVGSCELLERHHTTDLRVRNSPSGQVQGGGRGDEAGPPDVFVPKVNHPLPEVVLVAQLLGQDTATVVEESLTLVASGRNGDRRRRGVEGGVLRRRSNRRRRPSKRRRGAIAQYKVERSTPRVAFVVLLDLRGQHGTSLLEPVAKLGCDATQQLHIAKQRSKSSMNKGRTDQSRYLIY